MATLKDVAKLSNVSIATVSNYLNNTKQVSVKTQMTIEDAIRELEYSTDYTARSLKTKLNTDIFFICPDLANPFYEKILLGLERMLSQLGYNIIISLTNETPIIENKYISRAIKKHVAGIILITCQPENVDVFNKITHSKIPLVFIDRIPDKGFYNTICIDNESVIYNLTSTLLRRGIENIGLFTGPKLYSSEKKCCEGFFKSYEKYKIKPREIFNGHFNREDAFKTVMSLFLSNHIPEVYIATSIPISEGIMEAVSIYKMNNDDYNPIIISLSEDEWIKYTYSNIIKTMRPAEYIGEKAANIIIKNIKSPNYFENENITIQDMFRFDENLINFKNFSKNKNVKVKDVDIINVLMVDTPASYNAITALLPLFYSKENIRINMITMSQVDIYKEIISESEKHSSKYDIYAVDVPWIKFLSSRGYLYNISDFLANDSKLMESFIPGVPESFCQYNNEYYALPFTYATQLLFYRSDIFSDKIIQKEFERRFNVPLVPPKNWIEFNNIAEFFTKTFNENSPTLYGTSHAASFSDSMVAEFSPRQWSYGGKFFTKDGKAAFNSMENAKALTNYIESFSYASPNSLSNSILNQVEDFYNGDTAMIMTYLNYGAEIVDRFKSKVIGKVGYNIIPGHQPILGGWNLAINNYSSKVNNSYKFIKWVCGSEISLPYTIIGGNSTHVEPYKNRYLRSIYPWLRVSLESFKYCKKRENPYAFGKDVIPAKEWEESIYKIIRSAINKEITVEEALVEGQISLTNILKKYEYI